MKSEQLVNIREVTQKTGVAAVTLRAWERRYGLITPQRTPKGHRLYSDDNVEEINQIVKWLDRGVAISKVAALLAKNDEAELEINVATEAWQKEQLSLFNNVIELKQNSIGPLFDRLSKLMPFASLCENVYEPVTDQLTTRWQTKPLGYQLEQQLWQQSWQRQVTLTALRTGKQPTRADLWLVNIDENNITIDYWLSYALLLDSGRRINAINRLDDLVVLSRLKKTQDQPLIIFANNKINTKQLNQLLKMKGLWGDEAIVIGQAASIHSDILNEHGIEHISGSASRCWASTGYQAWLGHAETTD